VLGPGVLLVDQASAKERPLRQNFLVCYRLDLLGSSILSGTHMLKSGFSTLVICVGLSGCATQGFNPKPVAYSPAASTTCGNSLSPLSRVALASAPPVPTCGIGPSQFQVPFSGASCRPSNNVFSR